MRLSRSRDAVFVPFQEADWSPPASNVSNFDPSAVRKADINVVAPEIVHDASQSSSTPSYPFVFTIDIMFVTNVDRWFVTGPGKSPPKPSLILANTFTPAACAAEISAAVSPGVKSVKVPSEFGPYPT